MKYVLVCMMAATAVGCAPDREVVQIYKGDKGDQGISGTSCSVSQVEGGVALTCSDGSEAYVANGLEGPQGPQGIPGLDGEDGETGPAGEAGAATILNFSASACTQIVGTDSYVKRQNNNYKLYSASSCASNTAFAEVSEGESYWVDDTVLATHASTALRVIYFGGE